MRSTAVLSGVASLAFLLAACADRPVAPSSVEGPFRWGATNVHRLENLYLAGAPDRATLEAARAAGVSVVIDLREPQELEPDWDEAAAAAELGLRYHPVPLTRYLPFRKDRLHRISELVRDHRREKILIHCESGNRAAGWLVTHLVAERGLDAETATAVGRQAGITEDLIVELVYESLH